MTMKKYAKALINLLLSVFILLAVIFLLPRAIVFFMPFVIGWIIALIAAPPVRFLEEKLKIKRKISCAVVIILVIGLVVLAAYLIGGKLIRELMGFLDDLPDLWASLGEDFEEIGNNLSGLYNRLPQDIQETLNRIGENANGLAADIIGQLSTPTIEAVGDFAMQLPTIIIGIIMCLLSSYFFVAEREQFAETVRNYMPDGILYRYQIIKRSLFKAVGGYFKAQIRIEVWIYLLLVIGLVVLGVDYTLLIALGIAVLDFLPFFGTGTVMLPWAIVKFLSADYKMTIGLLLTWGISQLVRQIIQPKIVGDSIGVPPIPTLFLLFIGYKLAGVLGMIVAVPIGIIFWTLYKEGAFDTTRNSIRILTAGLNRFRKLTPEDMEVVDVYRRECEKEIKLTQEADTEGQDAEL